MGLRDDIQQAVGAAFDSTLSDVVAEFNHVRVSKGAYDPVSGSFAESRTNTPSRGVFDSFTAEELANSQIKSTDTRLIINGSDLVDVSPLVDDRIVATVSQSEYRVIKVKQVLLETEAIIWELQIRKVED